MKTRRKTRTARRWSPLAFERLEDRSLLAGNVAASIISGGTLRLLGDAESNQVLVERAGATSVRLTPLDDTTINGSSLPVTLAGFRKGIGLSAGSGDDLFQFAGEAASEFRVFGPVSLSTGLGNDTLEFNHFQVGKTLAIDTGPGDDEIIAAREEGADSGHGLVVFKTTGINTGSGDDTVELSSSYLAKNFSLNVNSDNDEVDLRRVFFHRQAVLVGGPGFDSLNTVATTFVRRPVIIQFEERTSVSGPLAADDSATVAEGGTVSIDVAANDQAFGADLDLTSIVVTDSPANGNVVVNANGTVSYTHNGSDTTSDSFRYTIADVNGEVSAEADVTITVTPVNDPPTIGAVADVTTNVNVATGPLSVTLADDITAAGSITLTGASSNTTLVPNANITFGGSGAARTVIVTPAANQTGTATITLTATDGGGLTATETFIVTVNAAPTISDVANATIDEDAQAGPFNVTVGDDLTAAGSLTLSATSSNTALVPNANITLGGSGSARTVLVSPVANASGATTITLTVTDAGGLTATDTFTVTVNAVNDPPVGTLDLFTVQENSGLIVSGNVLTNDNNGGDGGSLAVTALSSGSVGAPVVGAFGTFQVNADGSFTYDLDDTVAAVDQLLAGQELFDELTYTLSDGSATATALLRIRIQGAAG